MHGRRGVGGGVELVGERRRKRGLVARLDRHRIAQARPAALPALEQRGQRGLLGREPGNLRFDLAQRIARLGL
ncbi:MAG: hypothetical protein J4F33_09770, partial [Alphaproteobacteria bacterium]|nr:hypothetical protein [Alphaproteobacteria bacterium]